MKKAIFLDRDGVINLRLPGGRYVRRWEEFTFLDGVAEALRILRETGYLLVVVTNQRGIGLGIMTEEDLGEIHRRMEEELCRRGARLDAIYHCPHDVDAGCRCRKPGPGMLEAAIRRFGIDPAASLMVGDSPRDIEAGEAAGVGGIFIESAEEEAPPGTRTASSLLEAAEIIAAATESPGGE